jgi:hypothetical protein
MMALPGSRWSAKWCRRMASSRRPTPWRKTATLVTMPCSPGDLAIAISKYFAAARRSFSWEAMVARFAYENA